MSDLTQFIRADEAIKRTGLSERSLDRRLASGMVPVYRDPLDKRRRLIAVKDLDRLIDVTPFGRDRQGAEQVA